LPSLSLTPVDATSDFAELVLAVLGVAAKLERRRIKERTAVDGALLKNRDVPNSPLLKVAA
jgi:DNA invertase Pin-like site-specific DNA recombinase